MSMEQKRATSEHTFFLSDKNKGGNQTN